MGTHMNFLWLTMSFSSKFFKLSNCLILDKIPTLVLFFSLQSGEGHSQWAWPFTFIQVAPNLQTNSSQDVGASGPTEEMLAFSLDSDSSSCWEMWSQIKVVSAWIFMLHFYINGPHLAHYVYRCYACLKAIEWFL